MKNIIDQATETDPSMDLCGEIQINLLFAFKKKSHILYIYVENYNCEAVTNIYIVLRIQH